MYKAYHFQLTSKLQSKFEFSKDNNYLLRSKSKFKIKYVRTTLKHKCLSIYGVKLFNALPKEISCQHYLDSKRMLSFI